MPKFHRIEECNIHRDRISCPSHAGLRGRPVTFFLPAEIVGQFDGLCARLSCSRGWIIGKLILEVLPDMLKREEHRC